MDFEKGFAVKFCDLTEEAKTRFCKYCGTDVDNDFVVAADLPWFIHEKIIAAAELQEGV